MEIAKKILGHIPVMNTLFSAEEARKNFISKKLQELNDPFAKEIDRDPIARITGIERKEIQETEEGLIIAEERSSKITKDILTFLFKIMITIFRFTKFGGYPLFFLFIIIVPVIMVSITGSWPIAIILLLPFFLGIFIIGKVMQAIIKKTLKGNIVFNKTTGNFYQEPPEQYKQWLYKRYDPLPAKPLNDIYAIQLITGPYFPEHKDPTGDPYNYEMNLVLKTKERIPVLAYSAVGNSKQIAQKLATYLSVPLRDFAEKYVTNTQ